MTVVCSNPSLIFSIFFYQNETKSEEICGHERVGALDRVKLGLLDFSKFSQLSLDYIAEMRVKMGLALPI